MNERLLPICLPVTATIHETMATITQAPSRGAPSGLALVVAPEGRLEGIVTDGDIRRALVDGRSLDTRIADIMVREPITVLPGLTEQEMLNTMTAKVRQSGRIHDVKVQHLLIVDERGCVVDLVGLFELLERMDVGARSVAVIGLGHVGLTLAAALADVGFTVCGVERQQSVVELAKSGAAPFYEAGLEPLLRHQLAEGRLEVRSALASAADIYVIAVGTPLAADGTPVLENVAAAAQVIGDRLKKGDLVALRSTVPVGTSRNVVLPILEQRSGLRGGPDFHLVFAPERMVEGDALNELRQLPQILGGIDARSVELATRVFSRLAPSVVKVDSLESAEMVKLANNAYRDVSFAFANEFALVCDRWNLDAVTVIEAANMGYPRNPIPLPSPGVGGFCLTKDPLIYARAGSEKGFEPVLAAAGRAINQRMAAHVAGKVLDFLGRHGKDLATCEVFLLGFAFKGVPATSDTRDSSTLLLLPLLRRAGLKARGFDPVVSAEKIASFGVRPVSLGEGFEGADVVVVMNNHPSYKDMDLFSLLSRMRRPGLLLDGWHIFARRDVEQIAGIEYGGLSGAL